MQPVLFHIGSFPLRSFGLMILIGFFAALGLIKLRAKKFGLDAREVSDMAFYVLLAGILGARVLFILQDLPHYSQHPEKVFSLNFEGLTSFGGLLFGAATVIGWAAWKKVSIGRLTDLAGPAFVAGHIFGRIGCFLNGCCYGGVCDPALPWATQFQGTVGPHHPAQIYDALMNVVALGLLLLYERKGFRTGQGTGMFLILHGLTRFIYEFWRAGTPEQVKTGLASSTYWGNLPITEAQAVAGALMAVGVVIWLVAARRSQPAMVEPEMQAA